MKWPGQAPWVVRISDCANVVLPAVGMCHSAAGQTVPVTVCQMSNSTGDHQEVVVRGEIIGEPHHGFSVSASASVDSCPGWPQRFFTRPSVVLLDPLTPPGSR
jgi:hypothetical protein